MRYTYIIPLLLLVVTIMQGCKNPDEAPIFKRVGNIEVTKISGSEAYLNANAYFYNPNDVRMKLRKIEVDVAVEGNKIGTINQSVKTVIPAMAEFKVPLDATFNMKEVGFLKSVLSMLGGKKLKVRYTGHIRVSVHGFPVRVPVDYENEVRI